MTLAILTRAKDPDTARQRALELLTAALDKLGLADLAPHIEVEKVVGLPVLPGGAHVVDAAPPLDYRATTLPEGRVLRAACSGPLGEWVAFTNDHPGRVVAGRSPLEVLDELFQLPWGKKEAWVIHATEQLAAHPTAYGIRYPVPLL